MMKEGIGLKKPTVSERSMRKVLAVMMSGALAASAIAGPVAAFAATTHTYADATMTISSTGAAGADETFDAYKIFDADITVDATAAQDVASHIDWASNDAKTVTLAFLDSLTGTESYSAWLTAKGYTQAGAHDNAQNAAEFIAEKIAADSAASDFTSVTGTTSGQSEAVPVKASGSFTDRFARAIEGSSLAVTATSTTAGVISGVTEGYFMVMTTPSTIGADEAGSAPMFVPFGGAITSLQAKEAAPAVTFQVKEDKTAAFGGAADSNKDQDLDYKIVGTLPANINTYNNYHDQYVITLPTGLSTAGSAADAADQATTSFSVTLDGVDITSDATITADGRVITVNIADLKAVAASNSVALTNASAVTVAYQAHTNANMTMGSTGEQTTMTRTYTEDPITLTDQAASTLHVTNFAYQAHITKLDKSVHNPLAGAGFYIQAATDVAGTQYVQADGSLGTTPYEFVTGDGTNGTTLGEFHVPQLDEGVYTIHENTLPTGYLAPDSDAVLTITSSLDPVAQSITYSCSLTGGEAVEVEDDIPTTITSQTAATGLVNVQIVNEKAFAMPYTGLSGNIAFYVIAASLAVGGGLVFFVGKRRRENDQD